MSERYEFKAEVFETIIKDVRENMKLYMKVSENDCIFHQEDDIRVYVNKEGDYFSFEIAEKSFTINYRETVLSLGENKEFFSDRVEMLMIDALESTLNHILGITNKDKIGYSKLIDRLFSNMIRRREALAQKVSNDTKYQIVQKDLVKTYI